MPEKQDLKRLIDHGDQGLVSRISGLHPSTFSSFVNHSRVPRNSTNLEKRVNLAVSIWRKHKAEAIARAKQEFEETQRAQQ